MDKKYNLLVPLAGKGQRMVDKGYKFPKPLIFAGNKRILDYSMESVDYSECNLIFVIRRDHIYNYSFDKILRNQYGNDIQIVVAEEDTDGAVSSCALASHLIDNDIPLIILCSDIYFEPKFTPSPKMFENDGLILTFKANSLNYSYVLQDENDNVIKTAEKVVISNNASVGVYCFRSGKMFLQLADQAKLANLRTKNEFYICPLYNLLIANGGIVKTLQIPIMYIMGTPEELEFFKGVIFPFFLERSFILCSDHSGFEKKEQFKKILIEMNIPFIDCGCYSLDDCDYKDYIAQAMETKQYFPGALIIGFCRSGQGVNICANKYKDIRAALVTTAAAASLAIRHNAANFFSVAATVDASEMQGIVRALLIEKFEGGRHQNRLSGQK